MGSLKTGTIAAIAAALVLAGIVGWRFLGGDGDTTAPEAGEAAGMSTAPTLEELAERAEADPDNPVAWQELGLAYFGANRFDEAAAAYEKAVEADPDSAVLWSSLGEARVMASTDEPLPAPAIEAFRRALSLDGSDARARYFMAVQKDLGGDHEGAIADWLALLADTPPGAPWETDLVRTIQQVGAINDIEVEQRIASAAGTRDLLPADALSGPRGPTQEQMAAAASLSPDQQQSMAEGMVRNLANRLDAQGGSVDEWVMLMRSYQQMGRLGEARRTRDRALAAHPESESQINSVAENLGIRSN
ncbi:tetratricopeptide repeat protein [Aurantiacibacter sp. MUD11]|uniref:tetratricopeptide repeat protein n=1 Tax=Aurantiacibacter sp. MUD11 TaxID=3003265 RepID=UPI0022AA4807|nr:tetratricopeptide repeat protein [Aurantiacibacter sp. MUD11]WAT16837.1 tetratricopeptide repeat protein [Aurantiacibacter sp. MUD11]